MITDKASGFSSGFSSGAGNHWHTSLGSTATARMLYGDLSDGKTGRSASLTSVMDFGRGLMRAMSRGMMR